jgi:hypothetical protein
MPNLGGINMKKELLKKITNPDLKLAIAEAPDNVKQNGKLVPNPLFNMIANSLGRVLMQVQRLNDEGLYYANGDIYIYVGKGGVKVSETPKGVRKKLQQIALKHGLSVIINDGVLYKGDNISLETDGQIDTIHIVKNENYLLHGGEIVAPYAVVSVFKKDQMIARKLFIIPSIEYKEILKQGQGSKYPSMMAQKSVMKRVANNIFSLLGVTLDTEDTERIDEMGENMRVDTEPKPKVEKIDTEAALKELKEKTDLLDEVSLKSAKKELTQLISSELDKTKKELLVEFGKEINEALKNIGG